MRPEANCRAILIKDGSLSTSAGPSKPHPRTLFLYSLWNVSGPAIQSHHQLPCRQRKAREEIEGGNGIMWRKCTQGVTNLSLISGSTQVLSTTSADKLNGLKRVPSLFQGLHLWVWQIPGIT